MTPFIAELLGTAIIVLFGNGVVANVVLARTKGGGGGWIAITSGWAIGVFTGVFCAMPYSGAHLNPAVTLAMVAAGKLPWAMAPTYIAGQMAGAIVGAMLVLVFYREHFAATDDGDLKMACFCTAPNIRRIPRAFVCEVIGTFVLILPVFLMTGATLAMPAAGGTTQVVPIGLGTLGALPVALVVLGIGLSLGGTTGYAINPARDLGPRLVHWLLPVPGKRDSDWGYAWVPVVGPIAGGLLAALVFAFIQR